jgi:hypothetical protein
MRFLIFGRGLGEGGGRIPSGTNRRARDSLPHGTRKINEGSSILLFCHFFDLLIDVRTVLNSMPFVMAGAHKKGT